MYDPPPSLSLSYIIYIYRWSFSSSDRIWKSESCARPTAECGSTAMTSCSGRSAPTAEQGRTLNGTTTSKPNGGVSPRSGTSPFGNG